jgi:rhamnosyltransferase
VPNNAGVRPIGPISLAIAVDTAEVTRTGRARILVLLAAHNGVRWLAEQLDSILKQSNVDVHVVVSDDCSTDDTASLVGQYMASGRISMIRTPAPSGSAAQNFFHLIRQSDAAGFDCVAYSDQDDVWYANKLERASAALSVGSAAGYSSAVTAVWDDGRSRILGQQPRLTAADFLFEGAGQGCTFVLTAGFYARLREFVTRHPDLTGQLHYHDWATYALARCWQLDWVFDSEPSMLYRQHSGNDTGARQSLAGVGKRLALISSGWYSRHVRAIGRLCLAASPQSPIVQSWDALSHLTASTTRNVRIAWFCLRNGRRRALDRAILVWAALRGKI